MADSGELTTSTSVRRISPVRLVLTIFGDYWWRVDSPLPSAVLVSSLIDLGFKTAAARATLIRMTRAGLLDARREGRRTTHRLTVRGIEIVDEEASWLDSFGVDEPEWDGLWSVVAFSIPETQRATRYLARSRLKWLGFAPLYDGVWISPHDRAGAAMKELREIDVSDVTSMRASIQTSAPGGPQSAWALDLVADQYREFAASVSRIDPAVSPDVALAERMQLMMGWQSFRVLDIGIPLELAPRGWPRAATRRVWADRYNAFGPAAEDRVRSFVAPISPELTALVTSRRVAA